MRNIVNILFLVRVSVLTKYTNESYKSEQLILPTLAWTNSVCSMSFLWHCRKINHRNTTVTGKQNGSRHTYNTYTCTCMRTRSYLVWWTSETLSFLAVSQILTCPHSNSMKNDMWWLFYTTFLHLCFFPKHKVVTKIPCETLGCQNSQGVARILVARQKFSGNCMIYG